MDRRCKVCVTGGASYIGWYLVKKLLEKGYTVHSTLRNLKDESKAGRLKGFPQANTRLVLFEADIYRPDEFEPAIQGCEFVFHVATLYQHQTDSQFKNTGEAAVAGVRTIATYCMKSGTVRRLIYTASVVSASPLKDEEGSGFKDFMDETCWTPLNLSFAYSNDLNKNYTDSKTLAEREIPSYGNSENGGGLEVVSLVCGLVGGDTLLSYTPSSVLLLVSPLVEDNEATYHSLKFLEELIGKIPIVHIDDVCEAHIFCAECPSINGRFLVASSYASSADIANYHLHTYPEFPVKKEYLEGPKREIKWASTKLEDKGFVFKYDLRMILDDSIRCARGMGDL